MLSIPEDLLILIVTMAGVLLLTLSLNRFWRGEHRRLHNDLIGWQLSVLGTTYAVILGFMLYTVWTNYGAADLNADLEANALRNIYRLAEGLPAQQQDTVKSLARAYADAVVLHDWPEMANAQLPEESHEVNQKLWTTLMSVKNASATELLAEDHAISELTALTAHRRTRLLQSNSKLPFIFWCVLIVGGTLTIIEVALLGSKNDLLHLSQVLSVTLLITLVLLAIADVNLPFRGWVHVSSYAFERARQNMPAP